MNIKKANEAEHAEFLSLVNAEIRPDRAKSNAWEDFPLILGAQNRDNTLVCLTEGGGVAGGIACLIRDFKTSCGDIPVAGVGSVVTRPDHRGKGLSSALQNEMIDLLRGKNVPLAVLWTDQPEIYAGRGFVAAGWELHASLADLTTSGQGEFPGSIRDFRSSDVNLVENLYRQHPLGTVRQPGDSEALYTMIGTQGLVLENSNGEILASVFCGKGADFPLYVTEWSGGHQHVVPLLAEANRRGWANQVLIPAGEEDLINTLVDLGSSWFALASGYWKVLDPGLLGMTLEAYHLEYPRGSDNPQDWLGGVGEDGHPLLGPLTLAVWGFDSV